MAKEVIMPKFGFTQEESEILEWLHNEGDSVEKGDPIAVVSTDKISMEVESPGDGVLAGIKYQIGDVVPVTEIIAYILEPGEALPTTDKKPVSQPVKAEKTEKKVERLNASPLAKKLAKENNLDIQAITGSGEKGKVTKADVEAAIAKKVVRPTGKVPATPAARRIAKEKGIDLRRINGSGPKGRIQVHDTKGFAPQSAAGLQAHAKVESIPLIGMRRIIAQNMSRSWTEAPHMTLQMDIAVDAMEALRTAMNSYAENKKDRISLTAFITKAVAMALRKHPILNSQYTEQEITIMDDINIGIATALDNGLIVPVLHNADKKKLKDISKEIIHLAEKARSSKLNQEDLMNGTFTISNLGMYGIDRFTAIINPPQSAILAVGRMNRVYIPGEDNLPKIESIVTFTLSADHRVMDGVQAAKFLAELNDVVQIPEELVA